MPRRRYRDTDPLIRDRNQLEILGAPGLAGLSRMGGRPGGQGGSNIVIRGAGGPGTQIEHVTLYATTDQTIAAGGAGVEWDQLAGVPTEIRGFATLQEELASTGAVVAIPINLTGELEWQVDGEWDTYTGCETLTFTLTRDGDTVGDPVVYELGPVTSEWFEGSDDGWEVRAGDTLTVTLGNGSGSDQTLTSARLVLSITGTWSPTSTVTVPIPTPTSVTATSDEVGSPDPASLTPAVPADVEVGDLMIVSWVGRSLNGAYGAEGGWSPDPAWTELGVWSSGTREFSAIYSKVADADDVAGTAVYTWDLTGTYNYSSITVVAFPNSSGWSLGTPDQDADGSFSSDTTAEVTAPSGSFAIIIGAFRAVGPSTSVSGAIDATVLHTTASGSDARGGHIIGVAGPGETTTLTVSSSSIAKHFALWAVGVS